MSEELEIVIPDKTTDPQGYITYLESLLADVGSLGESGGIAFTDLYGMSAADETGVRHEVKISLTGRGKTAESALTNLLAGLAVAKKKYHMTPYRPGSGTSQPPQQSQPQPPATGTAPAAAPQAPQQVQPQAQAAAATAGNEIVDISEMGHLLSDTGKHMLRIKGGKYSKHGIIAWPELVQNTPLAEFESWPLGWTGRKPLPGMTKMETDGKKVIRFLP
jgi:hypothetical protein